MKKKVIYSTILAGLLLWGCSEDFTEKAATGALSDEALQNALGVDLKLTAAYSAMDGERINRQGEGVAAGGDNWWSDVVSDDAHRGSTDGDNTALFQVETLDWQTGNNWFLGRWSAIFGGVNRCNAVLDLISQIPDGDFTQQAGEALFLRAYYNFELQKFYGNVPFLSVENLVNQEFNQPNPGPIWAQIEADLTEAIGMLGSDVVVGRANSWVAKAYLGKALLYQGKYAAALTQLNDVINNGPYSLNAEFVDNFNFAGENGPESLFAIQFSADTGRSFNGNGAGTLNYPGGGPLGTCCGFYQPTQDLVNAYQTSGGLPLLDTYADTDVASDYGINSADPFTPHAGPLDPRLDYTVSRRGIDYNGFGLNPGKEWIRATFQDISGPYLPKKNVYQADEVDANRGTGGWGSDWSGINYNILRYADVLLMAAEAAVETNDLGTALNYVNQVRNRAKNMTYVQTVDGTGDAANYEIEPYGSFANQTEARKAVRFERRLELGMEGHRLFDLRRWGIAMETINTYIQNEGEDLYLSGYDSKFSTYQAKHDLYPIPVNAIDQSGGVLTQNPGY
ncbi:RagB/SusD family nutrient uptake outer membrane protein [Flagellimonas zhangzhouensis]|uniref:Starch-binding associating with outer membrane n=1 Tax=Flagellimonas zhangzhouensis TaxID=1073328 RepID=A0A1H2YAY5_9FLAO|nr:RagB/SusD family nutrient uptake outer membrane protein [Allomuricauda zhangzhouensis]SDQ97700.1 Starch-binding associating with outer membrane [Allomuricauda zhangzhouensis]SDX02201.1 Starch-binding associating with outer membrane [Allomuricauda zhangzhouensis]